MASKRDLIEAHKYSRRRLVSAFVSGTPRGKEVESLPQGRPVVAGVVLSALMVAAAALSGLLSPGLPDDWDQQGVVITEGSGERFLALDGTLYPVINTASARLLLPSDSGFRVEVVPDEAVAAAPRGATIGIVGAPDDLPAPDQLQQSGWTACLAPNGSTYLAIDPATRLEEDTESGVVLQHDGGQVLVTGGVRYEIPAQAQPSVRRILGLDTVPAVAAPGTFVDLYTPGSVLQWPLETIPGLGEPLPAAIGGPGGAASVGQLVRNVDVGGATSILTRTGAAPITPFAAALYSIQAPGGLGNAKDVTNADLSGVPNDTDPYAPENWPSDLPRTTTEQPCAALHTAGDQRAGTTLATVPPTHEMFAGRRVTVAAGSGALVRMSSTGTGTGPVFLVDQTATRFGVTVPSGEILARLGYPGVEPVRVPASWLAHLGDGPELDVDDARRAVSRGLTGADA
ncbi:type VII secretion protein EccB [Cellulomonas aerilata]|uniref:Type VII secretion protein EccB n=1 Tax=Cellulomonas aerilata TaxID=515326 RepID=A0A512DGC6_9CELL|nr:type VII secretion protein EccB [Cellulomonas aerilata]GEO35240.1 type VII secretion protein EccB [Cellulomonas aerilata]